jgi:signal peptidase I
MNLIKRVVGAIFDFLQGIVVVLAIMVMIYLFVMSPQEINGASMEPNFHNGNIFSPIKLNIN